MKGELGIMLNKGIKIFGITGATGSGKSYVSELFIKYGAFILNVDKLGHIVLQNEGYEEVVSYFGKDILDEALLIDRKKLGVIVFSQTDKLKQLNSIVHKHITNRAYKEVAIATKKYNIIVIDAALLVDLNLHLICTTTILVKASKNTRIKRIIYRDKITEKIASERIISQKNYSEFEKIADIVINND